MSRYLLRRFIQMVAVVLFSAAASYALLNLAPGGPLTGLHQVQQNNRFRLTAEDIARIRAYFELDLYLPVRFSRWLLGQPRGPVRLGGLTLFGDLVVGCRRPIETTVPAADGKLETRQTGCAEVVRLQSLDGRRVSRGVLFGDFGLLSPHKVQASGFFPVVINLRWLALACGHTNSLY